MSGLSRHVMLYDLIDRGVRLSWLYFSSIVLMGLTVKLTFYGEVSSIVVRT
jgi:hypothetical protein